MMEKYENVESNEFVVFRPINRAATTHKFYSDIDVSIEKALWESILDRIEMDLKKRRTERLRAAKAAKAALGGKVGK